MHKEHRYNKYTKIKLRIINGWSLVVALGTTSSAPQSNASLSSVNSPARSFFSDLLPSYAIPPFALKLPSSHDFSLGTRSSVICGRNLAIVFVECL